MKTLIFEEIDDFLNEAGDKTSFTTTEAYYDYAQKKIEEAGYEIVDIETYMNTYTFFIEK